MLNKVSPKVTAQAVTTIVVGTLIAALLAVTPQMLAFLGGWAPVAASAITALAGLLSGYFITDPIRQAGEAAISVHRSIAAATPHTTDAEIKAATNAAAFDAAVSGTPTDGSVVPDA